MTRDGAQMLSDSLSMRVFDIDDTIARLQDEKEMMQARIKELSEIINSSPIVPQTTRVVE